ncbi:MAG: amino acid adenylation domain-containing protein [Spirochaetales bacterium]|nr:amino acid adenylation domain-containing protein [Spirochaetales bacterium]
MKKNTTLKRYPLTSYQRDIFIEQSLYEDRTFYTIGETTEISGEIDHHLFQKAINLVIERHDALCIRIGEEDGEPYQYVTGPFPYTLPFYDFSCEKNHKRHYQLWIKERIAVQFDLCNHYLFEFALLKYNEKLYYWFQKYHHLITDGWGCFLIAQDTARIYNALIKKEPVITESSFSYIDFIEKNRAYRESEKCTRDIEFWKGKFRTIPERIQLKTKTESHSGHTESKRNTLIIKKELYVRWMSFSEKHKISTFIYILGSFFLYFSRMFSTNDLVFGIPFLNRRNPGFRKTVGLFVNTVPVRMTIDDNLSFSDFLINVRNAAGEAYRYSHLSSGEINSLFRNEHDTGRKLFDICLSYEIYHFDFHFNGSTIRSEALARENEANLLTIHVREYTKHDVRIDFDCQKRLFDAAFTMQSMISHLEYLFERLIDTPDTLIRQIEILTAEEKRRIIGDFNATKKEYPRDRTIIQLFEQIAGKNPLKPALVYGDHTLTYQELNEKANRIGKALREAGVKPDTIVGIETKTSFEMVIGTIGILKAGGAYLPVDHQCPGERKEYMLKECGAGILLTHTPLIDTLTFPGKIINIDEGVNTPGFSGPGNTENPGIENKPDDLAYVMFTSGTSGKPKGSMITQKGVIRLIKNTSYVQLDENTKTLQTSTVVFDIATFEIWGTLLNGGTLYVTERDAILDAERLKKVLLTYDINLLFLATALFNQLVEQGSPGVFSTLQYLLIGGEAISLKHVNMVRKACPDLKIINGYGPTENTTLSTSYEITGDFSEEIPIGKPISNSTCYIVDKHCNLLPVGVPGELLVGGDGVSKGYINRPELTKEKFIDDPFEPGGKLYKTGDLTRWLADGTIEYFGRIDNQVKIRGFRIEPGEIEKVMALFKGINEVVVIARTGNNDDKYLTAYYTADYAVNTEQLERFMQKRLPAYMIPPFYVKLPKFPLTINGKVDRTALPEPGINVHKKEDDTEQENETEKKVRLIWEDVLEIKGIGVNDNFYELGGHSIKAIQIIVRINREFQTNLRIGDMLDNPSIKELSLKIHENSNLPCQEIEVIPEKEYYPLSPGQKRIWILHSLEKDSCIYNIPFCFSGKGKLDTDALNKAYASVVRRHESLRTVFHYRNGTPYQTILDDPGYAVAIADGCNEKDKSEWLRFTVEKECRKSFDLETGPLSRILVIQYGQDEYLIVITMHHIISDGRSFELFISELSAFYNALCRNEKPDVSPLPIQYKDYTAWQHKLMSTDALKQQKEFWLTTLSGELTPVTLPPDFPRPAIQTYNGALLHYAIDDCIYRMLKASAVQNRTTLYSLLTTIVMVLLYRYTGQRDITIGVPVSGRNHILLEKQIGIYINTLVLRRELNGDRSFRENLKLVRETITRAFSNQDYPFDLLVDDLNVMRDTSRPPLFNVMVVLHKTRIHHLDLEGLASRNVMFEMNAVTTSKFDITFHFYETDEMLCLALEYNTDLYLPSRIHRLVNHMSELAQSIDRNPGQNIDSINFLAHTEKESILQFSENLDADYPVNDTLVGLFEKQVKKNPHKTALRWDNKEMSYEELNRKANCLAGLLRSCGIRRERVVALLLERSPEIVIAILGVIKAGGAYLPVSCDFPDDRINYMLKDSNAGCLLIGKDVRKNLRFTNKIITMDESLYRNFPTENPKPVNKPHDLAYIIYTSGTTGTPKGVMIEHRNVVRLLFNSKFPYHFDRDDVWTLFHSYCFDVSVWEMYGALLYGGTLVIVPRQATLDPGEYITLLYEHKVTVLNQTPSVFYALAEHALMPGKPELNFKYIIFAGEKLDPCKLAGWHKAYPSTRLFNMYGITEVTVHTTFKEIGNNEIEKNISNIGKAIPTSSVYILDKNRNLLPPGISGELYVGGAGVARGYLHLEQLTKERFIKNPFREGDILYRSGDYAKFLENGDIEYETRKDHQVQIRGFRVELGDIETHLRNIPGIKDAIVLNNTDERGQSSLCAYLVTRRKFTADELKQLLLKAVPHYMIPDKFVMIKKIPVTPNGKIDKKALKACTDYARPSRQYGEVQDEIEEKLFTIWKRLLQREDFGVHDSFFDLGGNSLLLIHLHSEIEKLSHSLLRVVDIFTYPSISDIAGLIRKKDTNSTVTYVTGKGGKSPKPTPGTDIAITGIGLRISHCRTKEEFWDCLCDNRDFLKDIPEAREKDALLFQDIPGQGFQGKAVKFKKLNYLERIDTFDPSFFHLSPMEASLMDPNQRIMLQTAWNTLEDAGYGGDKLKGSNTGVFIGFNSGKIRYDHLFPDNDTALANLALPGNTPSIIAGRISYLLDLRGPALCIDTACSSSLVAIHMACTSLQRGECDMSLAGGIRIYLCPVDNGITYQIESADGNIRPFDDAASGTMAGEGAVLFLLKPLKQAEHDNDTIYAVIKGSMVNQDGRSAGMTAPSSKAQAELLVKAWEQARIDPENLAFIEAHGTGTRLGDPIEAEGIRLAFRQYTGKKQFCALSSVKANIGHLDTAAGAASLLKSVLVLHHQLLPPLLHFTTPNREIDVASSPCYINTGPVKLDNNGAPLLCGISSFGLSGTNCHLVAGQYRPREKRNNTPGRSFLSIFTLSGKTYEVLLKQVNNYITFLKKHQDLRLPDICYTVNCGRGHYDYRLAIITRDILTLIDDLSVFAGYTEQNARSVTGDNPGICYNHFKTIPGSKKQQKDDEGADRIKEKINVFRSTGEQALLADIARLYVNGISVDWEELYRDMECRRIPLPVYPFRDERHWFIPESDTTALQGKSRRGSRFSENLENEALIQRCLARSPEQDIYSTVFSPDTFWVLKDHKVNNIPVLPGVAFLEIFSRLAARYYPGMDYTIDHLTLIEPLAVVTGTEKEVQIVVAKKDDRIVVKIISERLSNDKEQWITHARGEILPASGSKQHTVSIDHIKTGLEHLDHIDLYARSQGNRDMIQVGNQWKTIKDIYRRDGRVLVYLELDRAYLSGLEDFTLYPPLIDSAVSALLAFEPHPHLPYLYNNATVYGRTPASFYSYSEKKESESNLLCSVTLINPDGEVFAEFGEVGFKKIIKENIFYHMKWIQQDRLTGLPPFMNKRIAVFLHNDPFADEILACLQRENTRCIQVRPGNRFEQISRTEYLAGTEESDYFRLFQALNDEKADFFIHLLSLDNGNPDHHPTDGDSSYLEKTKQNGLYSAFFMVKGLMHCRYERCTVVFISRNVYKVSGNEKTYNPGNAALFGFAKVIHREYPHLYCRCIDMDTKTDINIVMDEIRNCVSLRDDDDTVYIALRENNRYGEELSEYKVNEEKANLLPVKTGNTYLITGGTGGIGLELAGFLAGKKNINLVLLSRSGLPGKEQWEGIVPETAEQAALLKPKESGRHSLYDEHEEMSATIKAVRRIEQSGSTVVWYAVDITDFTALKTVIQKVHARFGRIAGVIHIAGIPGKGFIVNKDIGQLKNVIAPRMEGTWYIDMLTEQDNPDFFIMCSAMSVHFGTAGQGDYNAANSFLDAYARYRNMKYRHTLSINWAAWKETGMAVRHRAPLDTVFYGLSTREALDAFDTVLRTDLENIIIGRLNKNFIMSLETDPVRFSGAIKQTLANPNAGHRASGRKPQKTVTLKGKKDGSYTETERIIAAVWAESLGFTEIDIDRDFYELGGDSINASVIINAINKKLALHLNMVSIFDYPSISGLAKHIDTAYRIRQTESRKEIPETKDIAEYYPLSAAQKRLFILHQLDRSAINYNLPVFYTITGPIDRKKLETSVKAVIQRQQSLRTSFHIVDNKPVQKINKNVDFELRTSTGTENELTAFIDAFINPFDLSKAPLLRAALFIINENKSFLLLDMHHIISDALSIEIFIDEVFTIYNDGKLCPLEAHYTDFTLWQNRLLKSEMLMKQKHYWMNLFADTIPVLELPLDFPRPEIQSYEGDVVCAFADPGLTEKLRNFAREHRVTMYTLVLSAFFILLHKYSRQDDIVIGSMTLTRPSGEFEKLIGLFINILPIRTRPEPEKRIIDYINEVKKQSLDAFENTDYQFDELVDQLDIKRNLRRNPLTDVYFSYMSFNKKAGEHIRINDTIQLSPYEGERKFASKADMTLFCTERFCTGRSCTGKDCLVFVFEYCSKLFTKSRMKRFSRHLPGILGAMIENPEMSIAGIDYMTAEEKRQVLIDFNRTGRDYPANETFVDLFRKAVREFPESKALVYGDESISYKELDRCSDYLASLLAGKGAKQNTSVGIFIHRSMEMIAAIIAVLKAGACYVPVDTVHPADRVMYMLDNSDAKILMTTAALTHDLSFNGKVVTVDHTKDKKAYGFTACKNKPDDLIYILHTSGSTGKPKGIAVEHGNFMNYLYYMKEIFRFSPCAGILCTTSISFDIFSFETMIPLTAGMQVVLLGDREQADPGVIADTIKKNSIDMIQFTPSRLSLLLKEDPVLECLKTVRILLLAGEKISPSLFRTVKKYYKNGFFNGYGPTEATVYTTIKDLTGADTVTIGTPVANSKVYILDRNDNIVPPGIPGELCISGRCVARGYIKNDEMNERHFKTNPFNPAERFYKSGDIAQWRDDGDIELFGRMDRQVKIRGYRIELSEIEMLIKEYHGITDCIVIDGRNELQQDYLCAYIVSSPGKGMEGLKNFLKQKLPDFMIPSSFVPIDSIPLNANGKIDRSRLPLPDRSHTMVTEDFIAPGQPRDRLIAGIWKQVLQIDRVGMNDNFFDLGGTSYSIIQLKAGLEKALQRDIELITLFKYPTIRLFSHYLDNGGEMADHDNGRADKLNRGKDKLRQRRQRREGTV